MNTKLEIEFPISALELEKIIRRHCEHHGVWDDCIIYAKKDKENGNNNKHKEN